APTAEKTFTYDAAGRVATAGANTFAYNDRGGLLGTSGPSGDSSFTYDADPNLTSRTDAAGTARYGYAHGRLATVQDGLTGTTQALGYNTSGQLSTVDYGAGRVRAFGYDDLARLTTDTLSASGTAVSSQTYGYDLNDWLGAKTTQGVAG